MGGVLLGIKAESRGGELVGAKWVCVITWPDRLPGLKTWAGQSTLPKIIAAHQRRLGKCNTADLFEARGVYRTSKGEGPSGLDASTCQDAIDVGFSASACGMDIECRPAVELLAILGLEAVPLVSFAPRVCGFAHAGKICASPWNNGTADISIGGASSGKQACRGWRSETLPASKTPPPKLLGHYRTPRCKPGQVFPCVVHGDCEVTGITDAPIPWPFARARGNVRQLLVSGDLERAIRTESQKAVAYYWGVSIWQVTDWRRALRVERMNPGTARLWRELAPARLGPDARARGGGSKPKITKAQVAQLRKRAARGERIVVLAQELGITRQYASAIVSGKARPT